MGVKTHIKNRHIAHRVHIRVHKAHTTHKSHGVCAQARTCAYIQPFIHYAWYTWAHKQPLCIAHMAHTAHIVCPDKQASVIGRWIGTHGAHSTHRLPTRTPIWVLVWGMKTLRTQFYVPLPVFRQPFFGDRHPYTCTHTHNHSSSRYSTHGGYSTPCIRSIRTQTRMHNPSIHRVHLVRRVHVVHPAEGFASNGVA